MVSLLGGYVSICDRDSLTGPENLTAEQVLVSTNSVQPGAYRCVAFAIDPSTQAPNNTIYKCRTLETEITLNYPPRSRQKLPIQTEVAACCGPTGAGVLSSAFAKFYYCPSKFQIKH